MRRIHLLQLVRAKLVSRRVIHRVLKQDPRLEKLPLLSAKQLSTEFKLPIKTCAKLKGSLENKTLVNAIIKDMNTCRLITIFDHVYPAFLKNIPDAPLVLYALGNLSLLSEKRMISVIGTRKPSSEGWEKVKRFISPLIEKEWTIISGLARGIDTFAHKATIHHKGKTIAVLGHGFNYIYPRENIGIANIIKQRGLLLSEYPPHIPPKRYHFPERNRIISGLSQALLVIEAKEKSGTMITVNEALDQGRDVYAVPGSPLLNEAKGCNKLIQEGAKLVLSADDILEDWPDERQLSFSI